MVLVLAWFDQKKVHFKAEIDLFLMWWLNLPQNKKLQDYFEFL